MKIPAGIFPNGYKMCRPFIKTYDRHIFSISTQKKNSFIVNNLSAGNEAQFVCQLTLWNPIKRKSTYKTARRKSYVCKPSKSF